MGEAMRQPIGASTRAFNQVVSLAARSGVSLAGAHELETIGRRSGRLRRTPVNPLTLDGRLHLVAPRGETDWVRNATAQPQVTLRLGRRRRGFRATRITGPQAAPVLRAYLARWAWEVGSFFPDGVGADSSEAELAALATRHPVFVLEPSL